MLEKLLKLEHELDDSGPTADWLNHSQLTSFLILPLFGWNLHVIEERPLLKCDLCFRALGLWNYNNTDGTMNVIDAEKEHRPYCPWINRSQAQITSTLVMPYSSQKSAQSVCGWEFMLNTITIECKHLEEMYDMSPKAEQQRKKLHNEAQALIKAAKSRLIEVLNGKWMKEVVASPVIDRAPEPLNEQVDPKPVEQAEQSISEAEAEQLIEPISEDIQKISHDNETLAEDLIQAITDTTDMEDAENIDQAKLEPIAEEMIEESASSHIPIEVIVSINETDQQISEVSAGEANLVADVATPELQTLEVIRDSAKVGSPGSSLDVNLSTYSSPRHESVDIDVSASADEEVAVDFSEHEQTVIETEEENLHVEEPITEVEQETSQSLESENIPQQLENPAPSSVGSPIEESESKQQFLEVDENITPANESDGDAHTTENTDFTETIESQLADEAQISAFDAAETIHQYEEQHIEEQVQEQGEAQEDSPSQVADFESTVVDEEIQDQMIATEDNTDETLTEDNVAKETEQESIDVEISQAETVDVDVNEVLVDDHENTHNTSDESNEVQPDVTHDTQVEEEEIVESAAIHETVESANEDDVEPHEHTIEESDLQYVVENENMAVDLTENENEQLPQDILAAADDEAIADETEGMDDDVTEIVAEDEGQVEVESVHEEVAADHMMEEVAENIIDDENKRTAANIPMETQSKVLEEEESENTVHTVHTDDDMSQYVEEEVIEETQAPEEEEKEEVNAPKEELGENARLELPTATEQVSTPSAFAIYDDIADNHEVLSPATTAAINEQIDNMDNDNELVPQPEKIGEEDEEETMTETQESQMTEISAGSDNGANDVANDAAVDPTKTTQHQQMDGEIITKAVDTSDDHDFSDFSEAKANEEQEQIDLDEDVPEEHVINEEQERNDLDKAITEQHIFNDEQEQNVLDDDIPEEHSISKEQEQNVLDENVPEINVINEEHEQHNSQEDIAEEHMQSDEVESHSLQANTIVVQESNAANVEDDVITADNQVVQENESAEQALSGIQEVEDNDQAQSSEEQDDNIPIQVEEISSDVAEQQSLDIANQEPINEPDAEQEVADSNDLPTETSEGVLSGDTDEGDHNLKIEDAPQDENPVQENLIAKDQDVEENDQQNGTFDSAQDTVNDEVLNNKVSIEVDGDALIEIPDTEPIESQAEADNGNLAPEDDGQLDDYIDADQFDTIDTEEVPDHAQPQSDSTALVALQAHDTSGDEQDILNVEKSSVADIPDPNSDISDAYELANDEEVAVMFQTETEQPMEGLESVADNDNQMTDSNDAQAQSSAALNADQIVMLAQPEDGSMDTEDITIEDAGMLDMEET